MTVYVLHVEQMPGTVRESLWTYVINPIQRGGLFIHFRDK